MSRVLQSVPLYFQRFPTLHGGSMQHDCNMGPIHSVVSAAAGCWKHPIATCHDAPYLGRVRRDWLQITQKH